jgi:hypothetical protein
MKPAGSNAAKRKLLHPSDMLRTAAVVVLGARTVLLEVSRGAAPWRGDDGDEEDTFHASINGRGGSRGKRECVNFW